MLILSNKTMSAFDSFTDQELAKAIEVNKETLKLLQSEEARRKKTQKDNDNMANLNALRRKIYLESNAYFYHPSEGLDEIKKRLNADKYCVVMLPTIKTDMGIYDLTNYNNTVDTLLRIKGFAELFSSFFEAFSFKIEDWSNENGYRVKIDVAMFINQSNNAPVKYLLPEKHYYCLVGDLEVYSETVYTRKINNGIQGTDCLCNITKLVKYQGRMCDCYQFSQFLPFQKLVAFPLY